ncbi:Oxidoreductase andH [Lachnellula arida]|uniref:Oxidoreductase andH n=1 Tax=Lachnellula arida TaxID=1316785 RepID=A0A8T9B2V1_9HELO|nr:Oxidoreductase andH [Lachnellula arida]
MSFQHLSYACEIRITGEGYRIEFCGSSLITRESPRHEKIKSKQHLSLNHWRCSFVFVAKDHCGNPTLIAALPQGLVALFIGATSGIGQSALQHFSQYASSPHIYSVARETSVASHENLLATLRQSNPTGTYNLITADVSLVSEIDKVVNASTQKESKVDIVFMSAGFMPFGGAPEHERGPRSVHDDPLLLANASSTADASLAQ